MSSRAEARRATDDIIGDEDTTPAEIAIARHRLDLERTAETFAADPVAIELPARRRLAKHSFAEVDA